MDAPQQHPGPVPPPVVLASRRPPDDLRRAVAQGRLGRVRRGAYAERVTEDGAARQARHDALARIAAVHAQVRLPFVFSHESAALLWGLDTVRLSRRTHVIQSSRPSTRNDPALARHVGRVPDAQRSVVRGYPVTSLARTVLDCARTLRGDSAVVVADSAVRAGLDLDEVRALLDAERGGRGVVGARRVVEAADGGAASPGESLTRWALLDAGLPVPTTQVAVTTRLGTFFLDLGWPPVRVGVEFDGRVKYSGAFGATATDAVFAEKRRQDALAEAGWRLLRVTWQDLADPGELAARARSLLRLAPSSALAA